MIFLAVGSQFPFDRLVKSVDEAVGRGDFREDIFAQVGNSSYQPKNFESVSFIEKHLFDSYFYRASSVISHAGMGIISIALENQKPMLVMPRQKRYAEAVNDHQVAIAKRLEELGLLLAAYEAEEMTERMLRLRSFIPSRRQRQEQGIVERVAAFLKEQAARRMNI